MSWCLSVVVSGWRSPRFQDSYSSPTPFGTKAFGSFKPKTPGGSKNSLANRLSHKAITIHLLRLPPASSHEIGRGEAGGNAAAGGDAGGGDCATAGAMAGAHQPTCQKKTRANCCGCARTWTG